MSFKRFKVQTCALQRKQQSGFENHFLLVLMGCAEAAMLPHPVPYVTSDPSSDGGKLAAFRVQPLVTTWIAFVDCQIVLLRIKSTSLALLALY